MLAVLVKLAGDISGGIWSGDMQNAGLDSTAATSVYEEAGPVGLAEVKVGEEYEIIVTSFADLMLRGSTRCLLPQHEVKELNLTGNLLLEWKGAQSEKGAYLKLPT
ncbi:hypothetical protein C5167_049218 [Papaver somniferum]|uniref:Uncharacterized protein n=1 Tax=Papaver somniferum TaxID=3469 RepID=A0A4Y7KNR7_PAPSO|nr:hypothetical protein C5167_049218 [Papaver somniferum]